MVYNINEEPKLRVETALVNASSCRDLLSIDSLVKFQLVFKAEIMSSIFGQMKKRGCTNSTSSNLSAPRKKPGAINDVSPLQALPPPLSVETKGLVKKSSTQDLTIFTPSRRRS